MTSSDDKYRVGYKRPPRKTRWKKGQSGNPRNRTPQQPESAVDMIDRLLVEPISITLNGDNKKIPAIGAIVLRLQQLAVSGSTRAYRVIQKYEAFVRQNAPKSLELTFVDSDYSRAFSRRPLRRRDE
jgi:Family of unknown function (DUF5681)